MNTKFTYKNEEFTCLNCARQNKPVRPFIRDHCQYCMCSLHVDVHPGDRAADCGGLMRALAFRKGKKTDYQILYQCEKCSYKHWNMMLPDDNMQIMESLNPYYEA